MRRTHWWGATAVAGVLLSAVVAAPTALAAGGAAIHETAATRAAVQSAASAVNASPEQRRKPRGRDNARTRYGRHGNHRGHGCHYPANGTHAVTIEGPGHVRAGRFIRLTAKVSLNNCSRSGIPVALWGSKDNKSWKRLGTASVGKDGKVSFGYLARTNTLMRVVVAGGQGMSPAQSEIYELIVSPRNR